ncbi:hypothetical protein HPB50_017590 [Hyalomma asiaticum]|uniref:Uncharacterized protein n=1 Tax=Hyalomma asiaticum TaxID=266040 RepID=A0ACB7S857_HYAAI|nr:hypothetical protein HPB50_017590 [Hyalomma asiaticum]
MEPSRSRSRSRSRVRINSQPTWADKAAKTDVIQKVVLECPSDVEPLKRLDHGQHCRIYLPRSGTEEQYAEKEQILQDLSDYVRSINYVPKVAPRSSGSSGRKRSQPAASSLSTPPEKARHIDGLSFRSPNATRAEEVAIALAASHRTAMVIITDLRFACSLYQHGTIAYLAAQVLQARPHGAFTLTPSALSGPLSTLVSPVVKWLMPLPASLSGTSAITQCREILNYYRTSRRLYPDPARGLSKADERLPRHLQTNTLCTAAAQHFMPDIHSHFARYGVLTDTYHMTAVCPTQGGYKKNCWSGRSALQVKPAPPSCGGQKARLGWLGSCQFAFSDGPTIPLPFSPPFHLLTGEA